MLWLAVCQAFVLLLVSMTARAAERPAQDLQFLTFSGPASQYRMAVYSNRDAARSAPGATLAIVIQHGTSRSGAGYFAALARLVADAGRARESILVIAPQFFTRQDDQPALPTSVPRWTSSGWPEGADAHGLPVSSLDAYDHLLEWLADRRQFPKLERIVLAGHSAGAQLVQRYAALNRTEEKLRRAGIAVRYVVANPSSYIYFTKERLTPAGFGPFDARACPTYDDYKYGFFNPVRYAAQVDPGAAFERYASRDVVYLFGANDTDPNHSQLDTTCAAAAQGRHRAERGLNYVRYLRHISGLGNLMQRAFEVDGVGHDHRSMFRSTCGVQALFEATTAPAGAAACQEIR
jgi:pimeloyl-ACP methyl ester carboxylesterase